MASPNIVGVTNINANSAFLVVSASEQSLVPAAATGHVLKINNILIGNVTANTANVTLNFHSAASLGGTSYRILKETAIPGNASLSVLDKSLYVTESNSVGILSGTASALEVVVAFDDISAL